MLSQQLQNDKQQQMIKQQQQQVQVQVQQQQMIQQVSLQKINANTERKWKVGMIDIMGC